MNEHFRKSFGVPYVFIMVIALFLALMTYGTARLIIGHIFLIMFAMFIIGWPILEWLPNDWWDNTTMKIKNFFRRKKGND